ASFDSEYEPQLEGGLGQAHEAAGATSTGEVVTGPEVSFTSGTKASAIARVAQEVTTTGEPDGRNVFYVMKLGLVLQDGSWKVDELEILSQTSD
ncbi:MAG TPA: hypothetical protein VFS18_00490, partial [Actinomycetota bacterium]|nr:hypothetical protein [Actinomycetota bacterium]